MATGGQVAMVTERLLRDVAEFEGTARQSAQNRARAEEQKALTDELNQAWLGVYRYGDVYATQKFIDTATDGLLVLAPVVRKWFFDYHLVDYLSRPVVNPQYALAATLILEAVFLTQDEVASSLTRIRDGVPGMIDAVANAHVDLLDSLRTKPLPHTPPLNMVQCAAMYGLRRDQFRYAIRKGTITSPPADWKRYQHPRRYLHSDPAMQRDALHRIRETFPEKVWPRKQR